MEQFKVINFKSKDGLIITADYYPVKDAKGFILLCHRSHFHRGEYREIAPKLTKMGFSCLAIDQRSGMNVLGLVNETKTLAKNQGLSTGYLDAKQDVEAAIEYSYKKNNNNPITIIGSSYSASLALLISTETDKIKAVVAFSPGEYLKKINLAEEIESINKPTFVTSTKKEIDTVTELIRFVDPSCITHFKPIVEGFHGARTLWESVEGHELFWFELEKFLLKSIKVS
ncbi:MAG: alpha/beta hydrolase [Flavobacteriaceae bacterium]|nr:alpha/beta hydrolase [Flavobacteriaceae bacterium]